MTTYNTTHNLVLFTVLDPKTINKIAKAYKAALDKAHNEEEEITSRQMKAKIGKQFVIKEEQQDNLPSELNIAEYIKSQKELLKRSFSGFLVIHSWTMQQLCDYFTKATMSKEPITKITFM